MASSFPTIELPTSMIPITTNASDIYTFCPKQFTCSSDNSSDNSSSVSFDIGRVPSYIAIASSSLSCLGSILIVLAFLLFKDLRTGAQKIITLLAIADFISAFGYIIGSGNFLLHFNERDYRKCKTFEIICEVQASVTSWSSLCSFCWTMILAFYFYMVIVYDRRQLAVKCLPLHNLIAWGTPLLVIIPLLALGKLGYAPYAASNWCFVKDLQFHKKPSKNINTVSIIVILVAGKFWEILTYIGVIIIYTHIARHISKVLLMKCSPVPSFPRSFFRSRGKRAFFHGCEKSCEGRLGHERKRQHYLLTQAPQVEQVEKRLVYIPIVFLILRMWGTAQFFYSIGVSGKNDKGCIPHEVQEGFLFFGIVQAIGDPGQGWGNAILYIFMSPVMRERLFCRPCRRSVRRLGRALLTVAPSSGSENEQSHSSDGSREEHSARGYGRQGQGPHRGVSTISSVISVIVEESQPGPGSIPGPPPGFVQTPTSESNSDLTGTDNYSVHASPGSDTEHSTD